MNKIVSPYFEDGVFAGARVTYRGEDFVIAPKNYRRGKRMRMPWREAMDALNADNLTTWDYTQISITMDFRIEISKVLEDNGGDSLNRRYWTNSEYMTNGAFAYDSNSVILDVFDKSRKWNVRAVKNLKD